MIIFDIKRYAINDGPGIRTTIFFKGCPLRCVWCHNPESWLPQPELLFKQTKCIGCNRCGVHPHQLEYTGRPTPLPLPFKEGSSQPQEEVLPMVGLCPTMALETCGRDYSVEELLAEIEKERDIMVDSGGGVTISGGEPLFQMKNEKGDSLLAFLHELGLRGFHRCVDTTLYASPEVVQAVAAETDLFLVDLKIMDEEKHKHLTGVSNERILSNLRFLATLGTPFQIRIPLIEGINTDKENIEAIAQFIEDLHVRFSKFNIQFKGIALLPYHDAGKDKHTRRGTTYNPDGIAMGTPTTTTLQRCIQQLAIHGIKASEGGG